VLRLGRQQLEDGILDRAAALFARRGFEQTSVQAVADAVGYSKAGLLHHYPSKEALHGAVLAQARALGRELVERVDGLPAGADRDLHVVEALADLALARPGLVSLMLNSATVPGPEKAGELEDVGSSVFEAFAVPDPEADRERCIRVIGASVAVGFLALTAHESGDPAAWRPHIVATAVDALGSAALGSRRGDPLPDPSQGEA
jgi:AcrR family transcriptional regulator